MQRKNKVLFRNLQSEIARLIKNKQSALIFGPRQVGKTTLVKNLTKATDDIIVLPFQNPEVRLAYEKDPSLLVRQAKAYKKHKLVFIDEAQKVPLIFDAVQYLIDENIASFIITGSSARKLKRKGANLLPGRVKSFKLTPMLFNEMGWLEGENSGIFKIKNINSVNRYSFEKSMVFGFLPGIINLKSDRDKADFLKSYSYIYLEEEIRAEALSRKIGAFSRFIELAAQESGTSPNFSKLSMESGVSAPAIKEFYNILEDTLVIERVDPYLKNARRRIFSSPKYYFFDLGVRNSMARLPLAPELINSQKGRLFEHAIILEIINRVRSLKLNWKVLYWRTSSGLEVDCVIDTGEELIPVEIKASSKISSVDAKGVVAFIKEYENAKRGFVIFQGDKPERISSNITALPWNWF
ncbi:MAG: ATP-binding protein [Elusimicrobia bacterium]|nr:ATP-binding protein [Elusimicrobiota bacterium]